MWSLGANPFDWSWVCSLVQAVVSSLVWHFERLGEDGIAVIAVEYHNVVITTR
jgi:hypothetical protein